MCMSMFFPECISVHHAVSADGGQMRALKSLELELYVIVSYHTDAENWALVFYESHKCSFAPELSVQTSIFVWLFVFKISYEYYGLYHFCPSFSPLQLPPVLYSLNFIVFSL